MSKGLTSQFLVKVIFLNSRDPLYCANGHVTIFNYFNVKTTSWRSRDCFRCQNIIWRVTWLLIMCKWSR